MFLSKGVETAYADIKPRVPGQRSKGTRRATAGEGGAGEKQRTLQGGRSDPVQRGKEPAAGKQLTYRNSPWTKGEPATEARLSHSSFPMVLLAKAITQLPPPQGQIALFQSSLKAF